MNTVADYYAALGMQVPEGINPNNIYNGAMPSTAVATNTPNYMDTGNMLGSGVGTVAGTFNNQAFGNMQAPAVKLGELPQSTVDTIDAGYNNFAAEAGDNPLGLSDTQLAQAGGAAPGSVFAGDTAGVTPDASNWSNQDTLGAVGLGMGLAGSIYNADQEKRRWSEGAAGRNALTNKLLEQTKGLEETREANTYNRNYRRNPGSGQ